VQLGWQRHVQVLLAGCGHDGLLRARISWQRDDHDP
jgi:hypothetical protein